MLTASRKDDAGATLVEVLVGMTLSTIIAAMALSLFVKVNDSTQDATDRTIDVAQARAVLQSWTGYLAVADGPTAGSTSHRFEWITGTDVLFHADLANRGSATDAVAAPTTVWLRLTNARLIEEQFAEGTVTPKVCRILADRVTAAPLFTAYDRSYAAMTGQNLGQPLATGSAGCTDLPPSITQTDPTAVADLGSVSRVEVSFSIADPRGHGTAFDSAADVQG